MSKFSFDNITIEGANLSSKEHSDGSFDIICGAYNVSSSEGAFYVISDSVRNLFSSTDRLNKEASAGNIKSEVEHPTMRFDERVEEFVERFRSFDENNTCCVMNKITLDVNPTRVAFQEEPVYLVRANITPTDSPLGAKLRSDLKDNTIDVAFSLRGFSNRQTINGVLYKESYFIVGYDRVSRPGIRVARQSQWLDFDIESEESVISDRDALKLYEYSRAKSMTDTESDADRSFYSTLATALTGCDDDSCVFLAY
jgi:hypothetical protein